MKPAREVTEGKSRARKSHIWVREDCDHYVEPAWCSRRLFEEEKFGGLIYDPACGFGTIVKSAWAVGASAIGSDIVDRGFEKGEVTNFFSQGGLFDNIVTNPPFDIAPQFAAHALKLALCKVAIIFPIARLNAAHWVLNTPLRRVWLMSPRPSMPPGYVVARGEKPSGGKMDYCWLVWEKGYLGPADLRWLYRDKTKQEGAT